MDQEEAHGNLVGAGIVLFLYLDGGYMDMCENPVSCTLGNGTYLYFALDIFSNFILKHIDS